MGAILGNKKSIDSLKNNALGLGSRKYYRKKTVWSCVSGRCSSEVRAMENKDDFDDVTTYFMFGAIKTIATAIALALIFSFIYFF